MSTTDGEHIAPVTWLFGAPEGSTTGQPSARLDAARSALSKAEAAPTPAPSGSGLERISNVSMHALARRAMSTRELHDHLRQREFDESEVNAELDRLDDAGLLDDGDLAETLVQRLRERKGLGRSALVAELKRRKLHPDAIDAALAEFEADDEVARATDLAQRRAPQLRSLDSETAKRRLGAYLMRKGYDGSVVSTAVARALEPTGPIFR